MKVVLVALNSQYIHTALAPRILRATAQADPEVASAWQITLWEGTINEDWRNSAAALYSLQADLYAFSVYIWNAEVVAYIGARLRQLLPHALLISGGPEISYDAADQLAAAPWLDGILCGEGEETFPALLKGINCSCTPADGVLPSNTCFSEDTTDALLPKDSHRVYPRAHDAMVSSKSAVLRSRLTALRLPGWVVQRQKVAAAEHKETVSLYPVVKDLSLLPFPYDDAEMAASTQRIYYYESTRGCPFDCQYCLSASQRPVRFRPLPLVYQDLDRFIAARVKQVKFVDRTFNCAPQHCKAIWRYLIDAAKKGATTSFHFELAAELIDEEMLRHLREAPPGLFQFEIGVQSANDATLSAIRRPNRLVLLQQRVRQLQALRGQHLHLDLIAGLPHEGWRESAASFNWVASLRPEMLQLGFLKMLRGSGLRKKAAAKGDLYSPLPPYEILQTNCLSHAELIRLQHIAELVDRYGNSGRFRLILQGLERHLGTAFTVYSRMSDFWREQGYAPTAREIVHYQRLAEFALSLGLSREETLCRLACDFCLFHRDEHLPAPLQLAVTQDNQQLSRELREELRREDSRLGATIYERFAGLQGLKGKAMWRRVRVERFLCSPDSLLYGAPQPSHPRELQLFVLEPDHYGKPKGKCLSVRLD